ncbi:hypothetical protein EEB18_010180 [Sphingopyxis sp. OPL5]|uniref:hypothetical protein n=1 Tax=Sphingopyxis sp. OPL5 TaxID=2486273 RepID=UPI00164E77B7|nr:hypothetical protein [Sphingopyxis sp. OPL5]QNO29262.1 hypothetical protein EEB18_010180 [Sphingopyxis sp. OPL5]
MGSFSETKALYSTLGPIRFSILMGGMIAFGLAFAGAEAWLSGKLNWPEAFGFQCRGRGCLFTKMGHSGQLLEAGGAYAWGLFALYWAMPAIAICAVIVIRLRRRRRNPIRPME